MQSLVSKGGDFSFGDMYEFDMPDHMILQLGDYHGFSFSVPGVGLSYGIKDAVDETKIEGGRVRGKFEMRPQEILNRPFSFTSSIDAAIITPNTRIRGPGDPVERSDHPVLADSPVPMPEGAEDVSRQGSNFRKTYTAMVAKPQADVASFYRQELGTKGWKQADAQATDGAMRFENDTMELLVALKQKGSKTAIEVVARKVAEARREGVLPEPGKGRLVFANAHNVDVVFTIGKTDYALKAGRGADDFRQALNYSVPPGTYAVVVKIPGKPQRTERIELVEGSTWGIIALPTGGYMPLQLY
jgi:hypothetical protein